MDDQLLSLLQQERMSSPTSSSADCMRVIAARAIDELAVDQFPVNLDWVASYFDITEIVSDPSLDVSGCLIRLDGKTIIRVRSDDVIGRRRFTIGHECGHTFLPGYYLTTQYRCAPVEFRPVKNKVKVESDEVLCDIAASELLLPGALVLPLILSSDFSLDTGKCSPRPPKRASSPQFGGSSMPGPSRRALSTWKSGRSRRKRVATRPGSYASPDGIRTATDGHSFSDTNPWRNPSSTTHSKELRCTR